jgi:lipopolysaccharide biosynthesis glycosyltransferase
MAKGKAWTTLISSVCYVQGALVLEQSIRDVGSKYPFVVMTNPDLPQVIFDIFKARNIPTRPIRHLKPPAGRHISDPHDKRFEDTWCKLRCFELVEYDRIVMLDSDMVMLRNMDELMDLELPSNDWIGAVHVCACNPMKYLHYPKDW